MVKKYSEHFTRIEQQYRRLHRNQLQGNFSLSISPLDWHKWANSALNLIKKTSGDNSIYTLNFLENYKKCVGWEEECNILFGIFQSCKEDYEFDLLKDEHLLVSGEIFGDFIATAKAALNEGQKDVAAVLACAALEDALKKFAEANGIIVQDNTMQTVINALKGAGLVSGAQKSLLEAMPRICNAAMHADWSKITQNEVGGVIGFVEQLLLTKFSGN